MFKSIMTPVDLSHRGKMEKALRAAADLSRLYNAPITYVGVTGTQPSAVAHSPEEFAAKLAAFVSEEAKAHGVAKASAKAVHVHDPAVDLDRTLLNAAKEIGADLVVVASHVPGIVDWPSHGGHLAGHSAATVMVVRD